MATSLTSLKPLNLNITDSYTFGNANVTANVVAGNVKTDNLLHANGVAWTFGGVPGGSNTYLQFNNSSNFGGSANLTFDSSTNVLTVAGNVATTNLSVSGSANLGEVGIIKISGGTANYVLKTDGAGNLSWTAQSGGSGTLTTVDSFTGDGANTAFTLSTTPTNANYTIAVVHGMVQPKSAYSVTGNVLTFSSAPANTAVIEITTIAGANGGGGGSALTIKDEGSNISTAATSIDFVGSGITATNSGNAITVTVPGTSNTTIRAQSMVMGIIFGG